MKIELICQCCNKSFETEFKFRDKKFCSRECFAEYIAVPINLKQALEQKKPMKGNAAS